MRKHIPHPITRQHSPYAELDIIHGGDERTALEESLVIARDLRDTLLDGENILHVNTLVSAGRLAHVMGKRFDHGARRGRNYFVTYSSHDFIHKLTAVRSIVEAKGIRYLVLTGFELATLTSRHRAEFMAWMRMMRNEGVNVIIFTMSSPGRYGSLGALRYSARTVSEVGAYLKQNEESDMLGRFEEAEAACVEAEEETLMSFEDSNIHDDSFADLPTVSRIYKGQPITEAVTQNDGHDFEHSDTDPLKTKDLALEMV